MPCRLNVCWALPRWLVALSCALVALCVCCVVDAQQHQAGESVNNWAVLVCTSRYWFNYRHMANTLGMYRTVKRLGIPDSNIILMLADDVACNPRNSFPGKVYANSGRHLDLYGESIEVDYRNYEVSVESFIRLLTGRTSPDTPVSKRLDTNENSNIFIYLTGHGGDEFLKFQDQEEISAYDIADAFQQMHTQKRYKEIFFMADTCQANTLYSKFYSPGVLATASSGKGENSYSHHSDPDLGVAVIDRYTHVVLNFLEGINKTSQATLQDLFNRYSFEDFHSNAGVRTDLYPRRPETVKLTEFFGGVADVDTTDIFSNSDVGKVEGVAAPNGRISKTDRKPVMRTDGYQSKPISAPLPASHKPLVIQSSATKEEGLAKERKTQSLHVETGVVILLGHAVCAVLWQCYKFGMLSSS